MENNAQDSIMKQSLLNAMEREKLLIKKYDEYSPYIKDDETKELLKEFQENAGEHIDLIKEKLRILEI